MKRKREKMTGRDLAALIVAAVGTNEELIGFVIDILDSRNVLIDSRSQKKICLLQFVDDALKEIYGTERLIAANLLKNYRQKNFPSLMDEIKLKIAQEIQKFEDKRVMEILIKMTRNK